MMNMHFDPVSWSMNTGIYEVNVRQYTPEGTFKAFAAAIPRLSDMGIKILWFMPITPISVERRLGSLGSYYACSNYTDTNPEFGTVHDFRQLVSLAHENGMKVIIDWVANHTGYDHVWTRTNPGFYKKNAAGEFYDKNGWNDVIDLNYYDHQMRRAMIACMEFWVKECNIDGFRCDMAHLVPLDFWRDARTYLDRIRPLFWLAETEDPNYQYVFDCSYAWKWMSATEKYMKGFASLDELRLLLTDYLLKTLPQSRHAFFTANHDENSWNGTEYEKYGEAAQALAVFATTWNGIALIYSGQELPNKKRLQFFEKDTIEWNGEYALHDFYKILLELKSSFGEEKAEIVMINTSQNKYVLAYVKSSSLQQIVVFLNLSSKHQAVEVDSSLLNGTYNEIFTGEKYKAPSIINVSMEPWSYLVFKRI